MAAHSRFPTRTIVNSEYLVSWLAAERPLAYSPAKPPARDYYFQYTWILPELFDPQVNPRQQHYFGSPLKQSALFLSDFWSRTRRGPGAAPQRYYELGWVAPNEVRAPLAAYHYVYKPYDTGFVLIQYGSYQWVSLDDQPGIDDGEVLLYRGIGDASTFRQLRFQANELAAGNREIWRKYLAVQAHMLSDSILSFNTIHDRIKRCEAHGLRDGTWLPNTLAASAGLQVQTPGSPGTYGRARSNRIPSIRRWESTNSAHTMSS